MAIAEETTAEVATNQVEQLTPALEAEEVEAEVVVTKKVEGVRLVASNNTKANKPTTKTIRMQVERHTPKPKKRR